MQRVMYVRYKGVRVYEVNGCKCMVKGMMVREYVKVAFWIFS